MNRSNVSKSAIEPVRLLLEDGTSLEGASFGAVRPVAGEVVFNTGMAGYVESLTDPSYKGQILVLTYPLIGNYGVPAPRVRGTLERPYESDTIQVQGLVVQNYINDFSHHSATRSLGAWLDSEQIPGISGIDTRGLTQKLREHGTMRGWLFAASMDADAARGQADEVEMTTDVFRRVAPPQPVSYPGGRLRILLVDAGAKDNIVRSLLERGATVDRVPYFEPLAAHAARADGILIGNGPGDPKDLMPLVQQVRELFDSYPRPIMGVCLGNQIIGLAAGGDTFKLRYGHRGVNQPVQDLLTRRSYVTSQNHGYAVREDSLPADFEPWFVNVNDGTNEGIRSRTRPICSVQFHPEASPGPRDTAYLFDEFLRLVGAMAGGR